MFKVLSVSLLLILTGKPSCSVPVFANEEIQLFNGFPSKTDDSTQLGLHILDFIDLIHIEEIFVAAIPYLTDQEVLNFVEFIMSSEFKEMVWEFESMEEFKESVAFLESKGYDVKRIIQLINSELNLPPFELRLTPRTGKGMSGLIQDLVHALPLEEMKQLFESKLENNAEVATLFEIINSDVFIDILKRMKKNPKFIEIRNVFERLGFDFKLICGLAKEIFGDYYQGIFCE